MNKEQCYGEYYVSRLEEEISKEQCKALSEGMTELLKVCLRTVTALENPIITESKVIIRPRARVDGIPIPDTPDTSNEITLGYKFFAKSNAPESIFKCEIPLKLPSLNEYIDACRSNAFKAAKMKKSVENDIMWFINKLPRYDNPICINFTWVEGNKKRDLDNICFAKKFILDAMVKAGKLKDDNRKCVTAFTDSFEYGKEWKVILEIEEMQNADS